MDPDLLLVGPDHVHSGDCPTCGGCRRLAPDAFGPGEPWCEYQARALELCLSYPLAGSAAACGLIRPVPCPDCAAHEKAPTVPSVESPGPVATGVI